MPTKKTALDFETSLQELKTLVEKMETGKLSLQESLIQFERGINLTRSCQKTLTEAEQKIQILLNKKGTQSLQPFLADEYSSDPKDNTANE